MITISFANEKGGVGKTTTTANVAAACAAQGARVLAVDMDPQASLTISFGINPEDVKVSVVELLLPAGEATATFDEVVLESPVLNEEFYEGASVHVLPMPEVRGDQLERALIANPLAAMNVVADLAAEVADRYDIMLIDTPPRKDSPLLSSALVASTGVVVVAEAQVFSVKGLQRTMGKIAQAQRINPNLRMLGTVLNRYKDRREAVEIENALRANNFEQFNTKIRDYALASRAVADGEAPAAISYPNSQIGLAYADLTQEIFDKLGQE